jgi:regulator of sirC expression with transglutaminase-like and TPR domain
MENQKIKPEVYEQIRPLLQLADDTDEFISKSVASKLSEFGNDIAAFLRQEISQTNNRQTAQTLGNAMHLLQKKALDKLKKFLDTHLASSTEPGLEQGMILLSGFGYPETSATQISSHLDDLALQTHDLFMEKQDKNDLTHLMCLNTVFFDRTGYSPPPTQHYMPDNSYIHAVIRDRIGIPISLSSLYMMVGMRSGIEIQGISMPLHFLVYHPALSALIDVYNRGIFISRQDCRNFIRKAGLEFHENMLAPTESFSMILRMIRNLAHAHQRNNDMWEYEQLQNLIDLYIPPPDRPSLHNPEEDNEL